jgi:SAM-dependent methyltransferase
MPDRTRARQLAAESLSAGDPHGWFERLYQEAAAGTAPVPWANLCPNPNLAGWWERNAFNAEGRSALIVGCGFGDDAEQIAAWGFQTTAFDVAPSAIERCLARFPQTPVAYRTADLLKPPADWKERFDFVFEAYTVQALPQSWRTQALLSVAGFVRQGGLLLLVARGREDSDPLGEMPWPLSRAELHTLETAGLALRSFEDYTEVVPDDAPIRRFRALYQRI